MRKFFVVIAGCGLAALPLGSPSGGSPAACRVPTGALAGEYPDHPLSPRESLQAFDTIFLGEVVVPSRKCSIGTCVGMRVRAAIKGRPGLAVLLRVATPKETAPCSDQPFVSKGSRWVVFANQGTSRSGQRYFDTGQDGPSFAAEDTPDFERLEGRYRLGRARLDQAIGDRLGRWR